MLIVAFALVCAYAYGLTGYEIQKGTACQCGNCQRERLVFGLAWPLVGIFIIGIIVSGLVVRGWKALKARFLSRSRTNKAA